MRKLIIAFLALLLHLSLYSQSYLGYTNKQVNLREGPGKNFPVLRVLKPQSNVFILSLSDEEGFYNVIDIKSNKLGYIHKDFIRVQEEVEKSESGLFNPSGTTNSLNSEIKITNSTSKELTLRLKKEVYSFWPNETRTILVPGGAYNFIASAPGVIPLYGQQELNSM